jgi:hypothetical protein
LSKRNSTSAGFKRKKAQNMAKLCRVAGGGEHRRGISPFCAHHSRAVLRHGHPEGRYLPPESFEAERQRVDAFLKKHEAHPGLVSSLSWLQSWLDQAHTGEAVPAQHDIQRLAMHGVKPLAMLTEAAALWLLSRSDPRRLVDDVRLTYAIGFHVLALAPREKRFGRVKGKPGYTYQIITKVPRRAVGERPRLTLGPLLQNLVEGIFAEQEAKNAFLLSLRKPFPTTAGEAQKAD